MVPVPDESIELLVVGGGKAGLTAAIEGSLAGLKVVLVDENPIDPALMGMDVPHMFGQRMTAAVQADRNLMERIALSDPLIEEAFESGVDVRLGVTAWGLFAHGQESRFIDGLVAGLADTEKSWTARCAHVIVAAGARDVVVGFDGWNLPGVVGARALHALIHTYGACSSRRALILGSGELGLATAIDAHDNGIEVVGVVEPAHFPRGPARLLGELQSRGIELLTGTVIRGARGNANGIGEVDLAAVDANGSPVDGHARTIACDTVCLAIAQVANVELLAAAGCRMRFDPGMRAWMPVVGQHSTSVARLQAVGDCAGPGRRADEIADDARGAARRAAAGTDLGISCEVLATAPGEPAEAEGWIDALVRSGGLDVLVCLCEGVTRAELLGIRPPAYLDARTGPIGTRSLRTLLEDGPPHPDQIKRLTRCGMGECQGRRCREQAAMLVARSAGLPLGRLPLASYRAPIRPLPLKVIAARTETPAMTEGWHGWFGIPTQFTPYWELSDTAGDVAATRSPEVAR